MCKDKDRRDSFINLLIILFVCSCFWGYVIYQWNEYLEHSEPFLTNLPIINELELKNGKRSLDG